MAKPYNEKDIEATASTPSSDHDHGVGEVKDLKIDKNQDAALEFLRSGGDVQPMTAADEKTLLRKIDWRIMPLMFGCYTLRESFRKSQWLVAIVLTYCYRVPGQDTYQLRECHGAPEGCQHHWSSV
jgi:hypothetical protein